MSLKDSLLKFRRDLGDDTRRRHAPAILESSVPSSPGLLRSSAEVRTARSVLRRTCLHAPDGVPVFAVTRLSLRKIKRQEAQRRMAARRQARRSPQTTAALQCRALLVGDGAPWRTTNWKQVARAMARPAPPWAFPRTAPAGGSVAIQLLMSPCLKSSHHRARPTAPVRLRIL